MRQLITRIDDTLHQDLKERAAAEGRSVNSLVGEILRDAVTPTDPHAALRARIRALGLEVTWTPTTTGDPLPREEAIELTRGWGTVVSEALEADRARR
ncbi:MAG: toxin-antitoxin system HicB family antitoxin [Chloroflexota bacterium]|nr:toxin-antitoxin system HicB family antitoxin [Chloroflexota bacterium]